MNDSGSTQDAVSPGQRLRAERERRNLSLQKAADAMRLDAWVIDALETDDYQRIGPTVYAKGHLKRYSSLLGLPTAEMLGGFETRNAAPGVPAAAPAKARRRGDTPAVAKWRWPRLLGLIGIAVIVGGVTLWRPWQQRAADQAAPNAGTVASQADSATAPDESGATSNSAAGIGSADGVTSPAATGSATAMGSGAPTSPRAATSLPAGVSPAAAAAAAAPASASPAGTSASAAGTAAAGLARLRFRFSADTWVDVFDATGQRLFSSEARAQSVRTIIGAAPLRVHVTNARAVRLELNGRPVDISPAFLTGNGARFAAGANGLLRPDAHAPDAHATDAHVSGTHAPDAYAPPGTHAPGVQPRPPAAGAQRPHG